MKNIISGKHPILEEQKQDLRTLFASPAYGLLREIIVAHCTEQQVDYANKSMYSNDNAAEQASAAKEKAQRYMATMDVLDDMGKLEEEWFLISLEQRR